MTKLRISGELALPLDVVTQRLAFLGRPGSGKSYAATKLAELMHDAGAQFIALDPVGIWYGLRLDGSGKGLPVPVFGGLHGDVPLAPTSGAMIADLVVDRRLSCVLDTSQFEHDTDKARFAAGFASRFYFRMKAAPAAVHVFLEECQEYVPQNPQRGEEQMLHDFTRIDKLGRNFGIGVSLISQRPQEVNKKVLNLTECLFAFQMTGAHERKAIKEWVVSVGADENILTVLPTLAVAHAHVYSPQWLRISEAVKIGEKRTADVSSTPAVGASKAAEKPLTPVDLGKIREAMTETIERAKAEDPKELRKEIATLKKQLAGKAPAAVEKPVTVVDQKAVERAVGRALDAQAAAISKANWETFKIGRKAVDQLDRAAAAITQAVPGLRAMLVRLETPVPVAPNGNGHGNGHTHAAVVAPTLAGTGSQPGGRSMRTVTPRAGSRTASSSDLPKGQQKILNALAELEALGVDQTSRYQLGMIAGYNLTGGSGAQHIADLGSLGLVELPDKGAVRLTDAGRGQADAADVPTTLDELHERVLRKLSGGQRRIAEYLISIYPESISRAELGEATGYNLTGGSGAQHVADLVTVGAAKIPSSGKVVASDLLFPEGLR